MLKTDEMLMCKLMSMSGRMTKPSFLLLLSSLCLLSFSLVACGDGDSALSREKAALEAQVEQLSGELEETQNAVLQISGERDEALTAAGVVGDLTAQRDEAQAQVGDLQAQLVEAQIALNAAQEREGRLSVTMSETLEELEVLRGELELLKGQLVSSSVDETRRDTLITELQKEKSTATSQLEILQMEFLSLQQENQELRQELGANGGLGGDATGNAAPLD